MTLEQTNELKLMQTDPTQAIKKLSLPVIASLIFMMLNNLINTAWVSGLGADPLAAVGFVTPLYMALIGLGTGLGSGANSLIARKIGAKDKQGANNVAAHSVILIILLTIIITVVCTLFLDNILYMLGAAKVITYARSYGFYIILGIFAILISNLLAAILRSEGSIKKATYPFIVAAFANMVIDPIFIYTLNFGVAGAAIGVMVCQTIFCLIPLIYWIFIEKSTYIEVSLKDYKSDFGIIKQILNVGIPASLEEIIMAILTALINGVLIYVGTTTSVAVFSATWRLVSIGIMPAVGVSIAAITVIGATYGASNWEMLKKAFNSSLEIAFIVSIGINIIFYVFAGEIAELFAYSSVNASLAPMIADSLRTVGLYIIIVPFGLIAASYFQGIGKGTYSLIISITRELILIILSIIIFAVVLGWGELGVYVGLVLGAMVGSAFAYIFSKYHLNKTIRINTKS